MKVKEYTIIGCGTLGSAVAYYITLKSLENPSIILNLIDNDVIEEKNLPHILPVDFDNYDYIGQSKSVILSETLRIVNPQLRIDPYYEDYLESKWNETIMIDCRDSIEENSEFKYKLNFDGDYGIINFTPGEKSITKQTNSRYSLGNSKFNAMLLAGIFSRIILNDIDLKEYGGERVMFSLDTQEVFNVHEVPTI